MSGASRSSTDDDRGALDGAGVTLHLQEGRGVFRHGNHALRVDREVTGYHVHTQWVNYGPPRMIYTLDGEVVSEEVAREFVHRAGHGSAHGPETEASIVVETPIGPTRVYWCGHTEPA